MKKINGSPKVAKRDFCMWVAIIESMILNNWIRAAKLCALGFWQFCS